MSSQARGLLNFIGEIRKLGNKEDEEKRVQKELANIRKNFAKERITSYDRKKYVWKLVYIHMLGYDVDFGHNEISVLLGALTYTEKAVGYVAAQLLVQETDDIMNIIINLVKNDLNSNTDFAQCLALHAIANSTLQIFNRLMPDCVNLLQRPQSTDRIRQKAAMCVIHYGRVAPESIVHAEVVGMMPQLLEQRGIGVLTSVTAMLKELAAKAPDVNEYASLVVYVVHLIQRQLLNASECVPRHYVYHDFPAPWLVVNLFRFLRLFENPPPQTIADQLLNTLRRFISSSPPVFAGIAHGATRSINSLNATNMVTFEMVSLVMAWTTQTSPLLRAAPAGAPGDADWSGLRVRALRLLSDKLESTDQNGRYVALKIINNVSRLPGGLEVVRANFGSILKNLDDPDISVKRRCIDLLFVIADSNSSQEIVEKLLKLLKLDNNQVPDNLREELVLKTAIIAERNAHDLRWYLGVILRLLETSGKFVVEDVWHRAVHIVTNNPKLQQYAASQAIRLIEERPAEMKAVQLAAYLLGEFGYLLTTEPEIGSADMDILTVSGDEQYEFLRQHFQDADNYTGALLMTTFAKMSNLYGGEVAAEVDKLFVHLEKHWAVDVQQRAIEYRRIRTGAGGIASEEILREMPLYADKGESTLLRRLRELTIENNEDETITFADTMTPKVTVNGNGAVGGGDDLLGLSSSPAPAAPAKAVSAAPAQAPGGSASAAKFKDLVWKTYLQRQGGLYDDANIQVLSQQRTAAAQAKVFICIKNKTPSQLTSLEVSFAPTQGVRMSVENLQPTIAANNQVTAMIHVDCYGPLNDFPTFTVTGASSAGPVRVDALLPVRGTSFVSEPVQSLSYDVFVSKWQEWGGEQAANFVLSAAKIMESAPEMERATASDDVTCIKKQLVRYLGMEVIINMNYSNETFSMGGFFSILKEGGQQSKIGVLLSFKIQNESVQCAVRTGHPMVTSMLQGELSEIYGM